ncbi:siderophore-interacting protein [Amycolatopsis acidicola]|uniref:Siderophore-interacting protein n=1 Tax=Amycolatopsis acidicola TaxID=2596893 RepID=A0A5N0UXB6_9PSEU|nr:siderophore-interacting protein [Amycolatopsis acidicola]KAA9158076.1 siderophore-interacting protein [Amycolatopsis acidicola]
MAGTRVERAALPGYVFRTVEVLETEMITPRVRRITFGGPELAGFGEDRSGPNVKIYVPLPGQKRPVMPVVGADGIARWPADDQRPTMRTYTVRDYDPVTRRLQLDFVLHQAGGAASNWAERAVPGDFLGLTGPGGRTVLPADWYLIAGDDAAVPAIVNLAPKMSRDATGVIFVEVADEKEKQEVEAPPGVEVRWLYRDGAPAGGTTILQDAVRSVPIPASGEGFAWVSAESATVRALRKYLRKEAGLSPERTLTIGYWKLGSTETDYSAKYDNDRDPARHEHHHEHHHHH